MQTEPLRLLLIDDDRGDRKLIRRLLDRGSRPVTVTEAASGSEALHHAGQPFDAILLDHLLPGGTGIEMIEVLRRNWPGAGIVLMTGQGSEDIAKRAIMEGANDYAAKGSLTPEALERALQNAASFARLQARLKEQREDLETFSEVLVHDLRAPIRGTLFLSEQIVEAAAEGDVQQVREQAALLHRAALRLSEMVNSLAAHVTQTAEEPPHWAPVRDVVERALAALQQDIAQTGAEIALQLGLTELFCRPAEIAQLLQNLLANAIKYRGASPARITVSARADGGGCRLSVADHGIGVPAEYRHRIFEPFKRVPSAAAIPGSGLGLATCRKIATRHGGRIWCDETVTEGTVFHLTLPAGPAAPLRQTCEAQPARATG